jgi:hypothetical protein
MAESHALTTLRHNRPGPQFGTVSAAICGEGARIPLYCNCRFPLPHTCGLPDLAACAKAPLLRGGASPSCIDWTSRALPIRHCNPRKQPTASMASSRSCAHSHKPVEKGSCRRREVLRELTTVARRGAQCITGQTIPQDRGPNHRTLVPCICRRSLSDCPTTVALCLNSLFCGA